MTSVRSPTPSRRRCAGCAHLEVLRDGDTVVARTHLGRAERVVLAGHLDTVPLAGNLPVRLEGEGRTPCCTAAAPST